MKIKGIIILIMGIMLLSSSMTTTSEKNRGHAIHVYGEVELDGESLSNANITLQSQDRLNEYHTVTNSNGEYDILANSNDHEDFLVIVQHGDGWEDDKWFESKGSITAYEINFEFQRNDNGNGSTTVITKTISFFEGIWAWLHTLSLWELLWWIVVFLILLILLIVLIKLLIPNGKRTPVRQPRQQSTDNDTIILLTGNGKVKKIR